MLRTPWLCRIQTEQSEIELHADATPQSLQMWSGLPWHRRLFETLVVHQHHTADRDAETWLGPSIQIRPEPVSTRTAYPLSLVVAGESGLRFHLTYRSGVLTPGLARTLLARVAQAAEALVEGLDQPVGRILGSMEPAVLPGVSNAGAPRAPTGGTPPGSAVEWVIARIWEELLGRTGIGVEHDFFGLGGNSLVATQVVARVTDRLGMDVPVSLVFEHPQIAAFAAALSARAAEPGKLERTAAIIRRVEAMSTEEISEALRNG